MQNLGMIDTVGSGIKTMFIQQRKRYLPMPEYDISDPQKVSLKIYGHILDENYTKLLIERADLDLKTTILLDKVQKRQAITKDAFAYLKKNGLVEGRYPNPFIALHIAAITGDQSSYIKYRAFDKKYYKDLVMLYLKGKGSASRQEVDELLENKLSDTLSKKQKLNKIHNLLYEMSKKG